PLHLHERDDDRGDLRVEHGARQRFRRIREQQQHAGDERERKTEPDDGHERRERRRRTAAREAQQPDVEPDREPGDDAEPERVQEQDERKREQRRALAHPYAQRRLLEPREYRRHGPIVSTAVENRNRRAADPRIFGGASIVRDTRRTSRLK